MTEVEIVLIAGKCVGGFLNVIFAIIGLYIFVKVVQFFVWAASGDQTPQSYNHRGPSPVNDSSSVDTKHGKKVL